MNFIRTVTVIAAALAVVVVVLTLVRLISPVDSNAENAHGGTPGGAIELPEPPLELQFPLTQAIAERRSVRNYLSTPITREQLSALLWSAQGITDGTHLRAAPSAGATYPLELYVLDENGIHRYLPARHAIETTSTQDRRSDLARAALNQTMIAQAPATIVIAADYSRTTGRYGERGIRFVHIETGHAAQNIHLQAVALGLASVPVGAYDDDSVKALLDLPRELDPLYIIPVGYQAP